MIHRGPDDSGIYLNNYVGLGFRRLSIVDLSKAANQPMSNENEKVWLLFNGEFYNHLDYKRYLESKDHTFKSLCDAEVLLHLYEENGQRCLDDINGMFAFAVWDDNNQTLFLARDRFGIKPLYYYHDSRTFVFASEIKAILQDDRINPRLNHDVLSEHLMFRFPAGENTLFKGIYELKPGHYITLDKNRAQFPIQKQYWDITTERDSVQFDADENTVITSLKNKLSESVGLRLMGDVALGMQLSGGIDSSLITAITSEKANFPLLTYSITFDEKEIDESLFVKQVAKRYETNHHEIRVKNKEYADLLPQMIWQMDEPLNHPSSILLYLLCKQAKEKVTILLAGEGADEIFGGYGRYMFLKKANFIKRYIPESFKSIFRLSSAQKMQTLIDVLSKSMDNLILYNSAFIKDLSGIYDSSHEVIPQLTYREELLNFGSRERFLNKVLYMDLKTYLQSILIRQDKMSMAAGIESRVPFLDHNAVMFAFNTPEKLKIKKKEGKYILKKLAEQYLSPELIYRPKMGFGIPLKKWLRDVQGLGRFIDMLLEKKTCERGFIEKQYYVKIVEQFRKGDNRLDEIIWILVNLEVWHRIFIDNSNEKSMRPLFS